MRKVDYKTKILSRLNNNEKWPEFVRSDFLEELNNFADSAFHKKSTEGYLAALLIYHQICEEMVKLLTECSEFLIQVAIFPDEIEFKRENNLMFGKLLSKLENGILDEDIKSFISKSRSLNNLRIRMVHKITLKTSIRDIEVQSNKAKKIFDEISEFFLLFMIITK